MSRTDNTRPITVVQQDRTVRRMNRSGNDTVITGGINSEKRHGKRRRNEAAKRRRRHVRGIMHEALRLAHDPDLIDIPPTRANKRTIGWRYA
jgi:hypothetical protein